MSKYLQVMIVFLLSSAVVLQAQELQEEKDSITWSLDVEDVVVTASYAPTDTRSAIHLVRVLGQEDIQRLQARNLQQLLVADVNIRMQQDPALGSRANLAGMDGQNIKIMVDGVPVVGRLDGNIDLSQIQLYDVERVEIVEGPLAVNYGTDALAGVINIITKKSQLNRYNVQLDASYEDRGERTTALGIGMRATDNLLLRAQVGLDEFAGFDPDSTRSTNWNPKVQEFANATARYNLSDHHHIRYTFKWLNEEVTNLGDVLRPQFRPYSFDERYITKRNDHALHYEGSVQDKWYISSFVAHNSFDRQVDHWRKDFESGENMAVPKNQDTSQVRSWHSRTTLAMQNPDSWVDFMVGMDHRYEDFRGRRVTNPDNENDNFAYILDNAIFGSAKFKLFEDKLLLESGVRYAINNRFTAPVLPSINAKFQLNENWTFRGSYGKGFRAPDIKELFFSFIDINHFILGNPKLRPETSDNYQAGFTYYRYHKDQEFTMGFHGFYNHVRDRIELYEYVETPNGKAPAVDTLTNDYTYFNIDEFRSTGLNVRMGYERSNWRIKAAYGLIGLYNEGYDDFDEFGRYTFTHEVSIDGRYTIPWINTDLQLVYRFHDNRVNFYPDVDDEGNAVVGRRFIEGFTNLDASLGKSFLNDRLRLTAGVRNLLAVTDVQVNGDNSVLGIHSTGQSRQLISTGRRWFVGMTYNLAW